MYVQGDCYNCLNIVLQKKEFKKIEPNVEV